MADLSRAGSPGRDAEPWRIVTREQRAYARLAGILLIANYALQGAGDFPTILARRGETFVETASWAARSAMLYRVSLVEVAASWIVFAVLGYALFVVLEPAHRRLAQLGLVMRLAAACVGAAGVMLRFAVARLYLASADPDVFTTAQLRTLVSAFTRAFSAGAEIAWLFMAVGSILFYVLFRRSGYLPRWLASTGIVAAVLVLLMTIAMFVIPERTNELKVLGLPGFAVDLVTAYWLLFRFPARVVSPLPSP